MTVSVEYASEHLPNLISALEQGEAVQITRVGKPDVRLALSQDATSEKITTVATEKSPRAAQFGILRDKMWLADDWDSAETNASIWEDFWEKIENEPAVDLRRDVER